MKDQAISIHNQLSRLQVKVEELISFFRQGHDYSELVNTHWSAKDVLGHLTFWHESFAQNLKDLVDGKKPNPLKGKLSEVNDRSVQYTRDCSLDKLLIRLSDAQKTINDNIHNQAIHMIPYKKGSRDYSKLEHLSIVENHIAKHLNVLIKKIK